MEEEEDRSNYLEFSSIAVMPPKKIFKHDCTKNKCWSLLHTGKTS